MKNMKIYSLSFFIACLSCIDGFAQSDTVYLDSKWMNTDRVAAVYYRIPVADSNGLFYANSYFMNGRIAMSGSYKNRGCSVEEGYFRYYDSSGFLLSEGGGHNGNREGEWKYYFRHLHRPRRIANYHTDMQDGVYIEYDSVTGNKIIEGNYRNAERSGLWKFYYPSSGTLKFETNIVDGGFDGVLKGYYEDGRLKREDVYKEGKLQSGKSYDHSGKRIKHVPYLVRPQYGGSLIDYLKKYTRYPPEAAEKLIHGFVRIHFTVAEDGSVNNISVLNSLGGGCTEEAVRVVRATAPWKPARLDGVIIPYDITIRIFFPIGARVFSFGK